MARATCPTCGLPRSPGAHFCSTCGSPLAGGVQTLQQKERQALAPGTLLADRYEIRAVLGEGGFSVVYGALDRRLNVPVAVKQNTESDSEAATLFIQEAQLLARLRHPNLVRVIDYFVDQRGQFLVMEYVRGKDFSQLMISARGRLPVEQVIEWGMEICAVLDYLHQQRPPVIHRDIKPSNLKLSPNGEVIVIDFGIAKVQRPGHATRRAAKAYTSGYSPLEQYLDKGTDERSDLYALGATLYHLLGGVPPQEATDRAAGTPLTPLIHRRPDVPPGIAAAIEAALALRPEDRPTSAREFSQMLERAMQAALASPVDVVWPGTQPAVMHIRQPAEPPSAQRIERRADSIIWHSDGKEMVLVAAGTFTMGSEDGDPDEQPLHHVDLPSFWIDRFPVTNAEYARFIAATGHRPPEHWHGLQPPAGMEDEPVVGVSWDDARTYALWAGKRLPSEAEWEKAARWDPALGRARRYPWGDEWDPQRCNSREAGAGAIVPIGIYTPQGDSPCGAGEMAGNVWEWTQSLYRPYPYHPGDGRERPEGSGLRVVRGGSWSASAAFVRAANRNVSAPSNVDPEIGFRCAVDAE
ncbi:MAG: hypothetical protein KatS3mg057_0270 [Herpetosiphonaceae bacterium]|nr:MAG: hypothetical protein KatS3mg057_0270 [Herpetosiphonaceae bacterium]